MGFLNGKRILITGLANKYSIACGIARAMYRENAELAFSYQNDKLKSRVEQCVTEFNSHIILPCDVAKDDSINNLFFQLSKIWPKFDGFVHAIAYAPNDQLKGDYIDSVTREGFNISHEISTYSFVAMAKASRNMLNTHASLMTLSYLGAERVVPNYNVMGLAKASLEANTRYMANSLGQQNIRVNAISAGPIRTLAASGINNFKKMISYYKLASPMRRIVSVEDIANVAAFLCSDLSLGITGEVIHVDGGFNITSMNELLLE